MGLTCRHPPRFVVRCGTRKNKHATIQRFFCTKCYKKFIIHSKYWKKKFPKHIILRALALIKKENKSTRVAAKTIQKEFGIYVSHCTIVHWIKQYAKKYTLPKSRPLSEETKRNISIAVKKYHALKRFHGLSA